MDTDKKSVNTTAADVVTVCPTKNGKGFKLVINGKWYYTNHARFKRLVEGKGNCVFAPIEEAAAAASPEVSA